MSDPIRPGIGCEGCGRPLVPRRWRKRPPSTATHHSRGLCVPCWRRRHQPQVAGTYRAAGRERRDALIDPVAVARACAGDRGIRLNRLERRAAVQQLTRAGVSIRETARRLGLAERSVSRIRRDTNHQSAKGIAA